MAKETLLRRISKRLGDPEDTKPEDIDRELEAAVEAIKAEKVEILKADSVFSNDWGEAGDKVYVMDLGPVYELIGGKNGRMAENLRESCDIEFAEHSIKGRSKADLEGDFFMMRFYGLNENDGFAKAATVVNAIGTGILGNRFEALEVPLLLVAADVAGVTNGDGSFNFDGLSEAVESGGFPISIDKPDDDAPEWVKLRWKKEVKNLETRKLEFKVKSKRKSRTIRTEEEKIKRSGGERRKLAIRHKGANRRKSLDRRGRGY